jgi:hypothetical protein
MQMDNSMAGAIVGILIVAVVAYSDALNDLTDETTSYKASCYKETNRRACHPLARTTYRVRPSSGEVVYWMKGDDLGTPRRLSNCSIWDSENWQCEYEDGSGPVVMFNGLLAKVKGANPAMVSLRWWQWHALDLTNTVGGSLRDWPALLTPDQRLCEFVGMGQRRFIACETPQ